MVKKYSNISISILKADEDEFERFCLIVGIDPKFKKRRKINPRLDEQDSNMEIVFIGISGVFTKFWKAFLDKADKVARAVEEEKKNIEEKDDNPEVVA